MRANKKATSHLSEVALSVVTDWKGACWVTKLSLLNVSDNYLLYFLSQLMKFSFERLHLQSSTMPPSSAF